MIIVHFEVYVLEGRGWMLHARFPRLERDEAVREAKELESTLGVRVKVIRETYNTDRNSFDEAEVYITNGSPPPPKRLPGGGGGGGRGAPAGRGIEAAAAAGSGSGGRGGAAKGRKPPSGGSLTLGPGATKVMWRLTLILLVAAGLSLGALKLVPTVVVFLYDFGFRVTPDQYSQLLIAVFGFVFLSVLVPMSLRFIPSNAPLTQRRYDYAAEAKARQKQAIDAKLKKSLNKLAKQAEHEEIQIPDSWGDEPAPEPEPPPLPDDDNLPEIRPDPDEALPPITPDPADLPPEPMPIEPMPIEAPPEKPKDKEKKKADGDESPPKTAAFDAAQKVCGRFLDNALDVTRKVVPTLDKYNAFALNLYMAGAIQTLGKLKKLDGKAQRALLKTALERLGTPGDMAAAFSDKLPSYMLEARYAKVVEAGRASMDSWAAGDEGTPQITLQTLLKDWNKPASDKKPSIMTVMFTDMVGSTDLTQARGDQAAQEIVRKHNAIVRTALTQFAGREVKHTGDGIMASFASAANAVDAVIQIQRHTATHNQKQPDLPLHLRIGLNAGEPIQEDDDLFGSTVQLAARVCAATQSDQTLCTQVVKDLASSKPIPWGNAGMHSLKGFRDKIQLWEIPW
jgi:class 3 adenylate cyclase